MRAEIGTLGTGGEPDRRRVAGGRPTGRRTVDRFLAELEGEGEPTPAGRSHGAATDARMSSLDRMLDDGKVGDNFASEMFAVVDLLDSSAALRRAVTDP
jgi:hypothetical protein